MKRLEEIQWFHQVPLKDGRITPGQAPMQKLERIYLFDQIDFRGKSVLDIGCWDGYFSFMAEQRGAKRVVALDDLACRWGGLDGFQFLHEHFQSSVEWKQGNIYQLPDEVFDVVLCYGVAYHLSDPLLGLINCFQRSRGLVAFESLLIENPTPALLLLESKFDGDISNIYAPSTSYMNRVAEMNGFRQLIHAQASEKRGTMIFELVERKTPIYPPACFPIPPAYATKG